MFEHKSHRNITYNAIVNILDLKEFTNYGPRDWCREFYSGLYVNYYYHQIS